MLIFLSLSIYISVSIDIHIFFFCVCVCVCVCTKMKKHQFFRGCFHLLNYLPIFNVLVFSPSLGHEFWMKGKRWGSFYFYWWPSVSNLRDVISVEKIFKFISHLSIYLSLSLYIYIYYFVHIYPSICFYQCHPVPLYPSQIVSAQSWWIKDFAFNIGNRMFKTLSFFFCFI